MAFARETRCVALSGVKRSCMWRALLLAMLGIVTGRKGVVKRQHHIYGPTSEGPDVKMYLGEPTLACAPDMFPPGGLLRASALSLASRVHVSTSKL